MTSDPTSFHQVDSWNKTLLDYLDEFPLSTDPEADVFLGGSCNPTLWRFVSAIPALESAGLSYFNPQVKEWSDDLMEKEAMAKTKAKVLFFVIDDETRAIASMIEASEFAALEKPMVLVINEVPAGAVIGGEEVGPNELKDLNRGRKFLEDVAHRHEVPVFKTVAEGIEKVIELLKTSAG